MRIILVDDEPVKLEEIKAMLEENMSVEIVGANTEPLETIKEISITLKYNELPKETKPDSGRKETK